MLDGKGRVVHESRHPAPGLVDHVGVHRVLREGQVEQDLAIGRRVVLACSRLIAIEVDPDLAAALRERFHGRDNVSVLESDVLALAPEEILSQGGGRLPYVVAGNLPYSIGSAIVRHFLAASAQPRWLLVTLQSEVARNMAAGPGRMSFLSVETQYYAQPRALFDIPPGAFRPPPKGLKCALS